MSDDMSMIKFKQVQFHLNYQIKRDPESYHSQMIILDSDIWPHDKNGEGGKAWYVHYSSKEKLSLDKLKPILSNLMKKSLKSNGMHVDFNKYEEKVIEN